MRNTELVQDLCLIQPNCLPYLPWCQTACTLLSLCTLSTTYYSVLDLKHAFFTICIPSFPASCSLGLTLTPTRLSRIAKHAAARLLNQPPLRPQQTRFLLITFCLSQMNFLRKKHMLSLWSVSHFEVISQTPIPSTKPNDSFSFLGMVSKVRDSYTRALGRLQPFCPAGWTLLF